MTKIKDLTTGFGTLSYGSVTFSVMRNCTFRYEPRYLDSARRVIALDCYLSVVARVHGSDATSSTRTRTQSRMDSLVDQLSQSGKRLIIQDIGLGGAIDTGSTTPDIDFGPRPRVISWRPIGGDLVGEVVWECHFTIPPKCASNSINAGEVMSFEYAIAYQTNNEGLLTRVITGHIGIVQFRNGLKIAANPEAAYDKIIFNCPQYFQPVTFSRQINHARNRIDFVCVHEEQTNEAYPEGIIEADVDQDLENIPPGFINWQGTLSGTMRVAPGVAKKVAADKFFIIMFDVAKHLNDAAGAKGIVIPERIRFGTKKFGRTSRFFVQWRMVACLHEILAKAGIWSSVPGTDYTKWKASMQKIGLFSPRGIGGYRFNANDDVILDLCEQPAKVSIGNDTGYRTTPGGDAKLSLDCPEVTKEKSYLFFKNAIQGVQSQSVILHKIMQAFKPGIATVGDGILAPFIGSGGSSSNAEKQDIAQYSGTSEDYVLMTGRALRLKFTPEIPKLESVGGVKLEELGRQVVVEPEASYFDCPLIGARWAVLYRVKGGSLHGVKPPKIKELCMKDGEDDGRK